MSPWNLLRLAQAFVAIGVTVTVLLSLLGLYEVAVFIRDRWRSFSASRRLRRFGPAASGPEVSPDT